MENSYIKKYKEYIAFLRENQDDLLDNDNWDSLFSVLPFLKLSDEYTLDDYRSKDSTNNILHLYALKVGTERPDEKEFKPYKPLKEKEIIEYENFINDTKFDFCPKVTIDGDVATIEHIAVFFHNRFCKCTAKAYYNTVDKKIEKFEFDNVDLFRFASHFMF